MAKDAKNYFRNGRPRQGLIPHRKYYQVAMEFERGAAAQEVYAIAQESKNPVFARAYAILTR